VILSSDLSAVQVVDTRHFVEQHFRHVWIFCLHENTWKGLLCSARLNRGAVYRPPQWLCRALGGLCVCVCVCVCVWTTTLERSDLWPIFGMLVHLSTICVKFEVQNHRSEFKITWWKCSFCFEKWKWHW